jgi:hypothetical protein
MYLPKTSTNLSGQVTGQKVLLVVTAQNNPIGEPETTISMI